MHQAATPAFARPGGRGPELDHAKYPGIYSERGRPPGRADDMDFAAATSVRTVLTIAAGVADQGQVATSGGVGRNVSMAMTMTGEATLPAARPQVWALLNDPDVLKACIPGCESLERTGDNGFAAVARVKIGPVNATFRGKVQLSDLVPLEGYTISGEGEGGVAGFAKGGAKVSLADAEGGTILRYDVEAHVGGKIAQLGSRLIDGVAKSMADKFFANFAEAARAASPGQARAPTVEAPPQQQSWFRRIWEWFMSLWR